ncbi:28S ribosomal protein S35, mitochondrial [Drosophila guanche]|uniref:Blast:28S ribosomal protein S35, mitochondrial n=1 Tax=Drosophila guanche TaxID=7266 RepID=A0A3B0J586_DROGU|nr:28S ribosomal protein S35, mitochondrial [Drosophila guanche]SPP77094.1 blast:28S ribosomal protein S35%2C mitochondrial [Drosophila guanche]
MAASLTRLLERSLRTTHAPQSSVRLFSNGSQKQQQQQPEVEDEEEFRVLNLRPVKQQFQRRRDIRRDDVTPPRTTRMAVDQDWTAAWPGPRSFHPASVPLPLRQGFTERGAAAPSKFANAELMKIPNFLHLTPPAIRQQCEAIKKFCTPWPKGLETEAKWKPHFPVEVITTDYCQSLPTVRNPEARRVTVSLKLSDLKFDNHARDKFLRLVGERYNKETDVLTFVTDRCPLRKQNYDYALYLLTACYHESFVTEPWEATKSEADMELYLFERNQAKRSAEAILNWNAAEGAPKKAASASYAQCVEQLINEGENEYNLAKYKEEVMKMLNVAAQ